MQVAQLWVYPIKSCRGVALTAATVTPTGLERDRAYMIVDTEGKFLTQRQHPALAQLMVTWDEQALYLTDTREAKAHPCVVPFTQTGNLIPAQVWRSKTTAIDQGEDVADWLTERIGQPVRLVRQSPEHPRYANPKYARTTQAPVSFADGYPLLVTNTASLADLNARLAAKGANPVPMERFRPNLVIESDVPFGEDDWPALQIGDVQLDLVKPCDRCIVTTTDQQTGDRDPAQEPLATLRTFRHQPRAGVLFGENAIPRSLGEIRVGAVVTTVRGD